MRSTRSTTARSARLESNLNHSQERQSQHNENQVISTRRHCGVHLQSRQRTMRLDTTTVHRLLWTGRQDVRLPGTRLTTVTNSTRTERRFASRFKTESPWTFNTSAPAYSLPPRSTNFSTRTQRVQFWDYTPTYHQGVELEQHWLARKRGVPFICATYSKDATRSGRHGYRLDIGTVASIDAGTRQRQFHGTVRGP
jgi:hypothetical protein